MDITKIEKEIKYEFQDKNLLLKALAHSSYVNERKGNQESNERLEFLGDSVLGLVISRYLYMQHRNSAEGSLTKLRAAIVSEPALTKVAYRLKLGEFIMLGKGEENTGGRKRGSILSDAVEAVIAAVYLDGGYDTAEKFVLEALSQSISAAEAGNGIKDYKTTLQETMQKKVGETLQYRIINETGPDHQKTFTVSVKCAGEVLGEGTGRSKKEAEQNAAKEALKKSVFKG